MSRGRQCQCCRPAPLLSYSPTWRAQPACSSDSASATAKCWAEHQRLLRTAFHDYGGHEVDTQGDSFFVTFARAADAVQAAVMAQRALAAHPWPEGTAVRVRMGLHTGEPTLAGRTYVGLDVHRAARIAAAGHGGQVLLSEATRVLVERELPPGVSLRDLGEHRLKDLPGQSTSSSSSPRTSRPTSRRFESSTCGPHNLPVRATQLSSGARGRRPR